LTARQILIDYLGNNGLTVSWKEVAMARLARVEVFASDEIALVHVMNRTVRRCFLMGNDPLTGKNFDHRKGWMEEELQHLASHFGIDLLCYAILSNHFHLILRSRPDVVAIWDDTEVARRWLMLCPKRRTADNRPEEPSESELDTIRHDPARLQEIRSRLSDISWWMRLLSQKIGRMANQEDGEVGKFWQARYRAVRLLDETAILACAAYVDLNPIRAAMAQTIETSDYTSAQQRALELQQSLMVTTPKDKAASSNDRSADEVKHESLSQKMTSPMLVSKQTVKSIANSLCPLSLDEPTSELGACVHRAGFRASDKGFLPMNVADYLELLDWTARQMRSDKRNSTPACAEPIFERMGIGVEAWCELTKNFGRLFSTVAGKPNVIDATRSRHRGQRYHVRSQARHLLVA
jgi:hypothetical protein